MSRRGNSLGTADAEEAGRKSTQTAAEAVAADAGDRGTLDETWRRTGDEKRKGREGELIAAARE